MLENVYEGLDARSIVYLSKVYFCEMYMTCVSSKLCEFIVCIILQLFFLVNNQANYKQLPTQSTKIS